MLQVVARGGGLGKTVRCAWIAVGFRRIVPGAGEGGVRPVSPAAKGPARLRRSSPGSCSRRPSAFPRHGFSDRARHWPGQRRRHRHLPPLPRRRAVFRSRRSRWYCRESLSTRRLLALAIASHRRPRADRPRSLVLAPTLAPAGDRPMTAMMDSCSRTPTRMGRSPVPAMTSPWQTISRPRTPKAFSTPRRFAGAGRERRSSRRRRKRLGMFPNRFGI